LRFTYTSSGLDVYGRFVVYFFTLCTKEAGNGLYIAHAPFCTLTSWFTVTLAVASPVIVVWMDGWTDGTVID